MGMQFLYKLPIGAEDDVFEGDNWFIEMKVVWPLDTADGAIL